MEVSRIERGVSPRVPVETLFQLAPVVGLRLSMKLYPEGPPVRDAARLGVFSHLRPRVHEAFRWRHEVPVTDDPADLRAWDAEITREVVLIHFEVEVNLVDVQALHRRLALKRRDGVPGILILVVRSTHRNRRILREAAGPLLEAFPLRTRSVLAALARGEDPGADATILL